jgi:calcineurin-like phosphoesterase family protein
MESNIFFTADTHFKHYLPAMNRPFIGIEMDKLLINNWNEAIKPSDEVFFLGDFALKASLEEMKYTFSLLHGNKHLILGNHDFNNKIKKLRWGSIHEVFEFHIPERWTKQAGCGTIWLSHYPHRSWPRSFHGSLHLYGHCHGHSTPYFNSMDVGMDANNYKPLSLEEVLVKIPRGILRV